MIGITLQNRYEIREQLGKGGMSIVYLAFDTLLERQVAIKVLSGQALGTHGRARLLNEARATARLNHPNIVTVFDAGEYEEQPFIVMELIEGKSLKLAAQQSLSTLEDILRFIIQICAALEHAHARGVIHRDIKPENIFITPDGSAKLMDFGLARSLASRLTVEGSFIGTVYYIAPEQALGQEIDPRTDLYALGVMLYELTAGQLPFTASDPFSIITQHLYASPVPPRIHNAEIPQALDKLILQMMEKKSGDRPSSAQEVRLRLESLLLQISHPLQAAPGIAEESLSMLDHIARGRMVGRERELAEARSYWKKALMGEGQLLLISGEPGIGKSRLVREIVTQVEVSGHIALFGECYAEGGAPYYPFAQIVRKILLDHNPNTTSLPHYVLADLLSIATDLNINFPDIQPNPKLDPQAEQQRLFENFVILFNSLDQSHAVSLVIEDAHWADQGSLALLRHLARRLQNQRIMLMATYREIELERGRPAHEILLGLHRERTANRIKLSRLDPPATHALLETIFSETITQDFLENIYRETEGNPFFIEEVCKALVESGNLYFDNGRWIKPGGSPLEIPQSIRIAIQSRIDKLPPSTQQMLTLAAVVGREFDFDTLLNASELDENTLIETLELAEHAQLIEEVGSQSGGSFAFVHALIPSTIVESISGIRRRRMHRRIAESTERIHPEHTEALAYQYSLAEVEDKAIFYLLRAGQKAQAQFANDEAIKFYTHALEFARPNSSQAFDLLAARARVYRLTAQRDEQYSNIQSMLSLAEKLNDDQKRFDAQLALADYYVDTDFSLARQPAEAALALAQKLNNPLFQARAFHILGVEANAQTHFSRSREFLHQAADSFQKAGLVSDAAKSLSLLSVVLGNQRQYDEAQQAAEQAIDLSRQAQDPLQEATALRRLAIRFLQQERYAEAQPWAEQALALHQRVGDRNEECHDLNVLGSILAGQGKYQEAEAYLLQGLELSDATDNRLAEYYIGSALGNLIYRPLGDFDKELAFYDSLAVKFRQTQNTLGVEAILWSQIDLLSNLGQFEKTLPLVEELCASIRSRNDSETLCSALGLKARIQAQLDNIDNLEKAQETLQESLALFTGIAEPGNNGPLFDAAYVSWLSEDAQFWRRGVEYVQNTLPALRKQNVGVALGYAFDMLARLHLVLEEFDQALDSSDQAMALAQKHPNISLEQIQFTHSRVLRATGQETEANYHLRLAYMHLEKTAAKISDQSLRSSFLNNVRYNQQLRNEAQQRGLIG